MSKDQHARQRNARNLQSPPSGRNDDDTHALRAGKSGPTQRKSAQRKEPSTRQPGRDDHRDGSDSNR